MASKSQGVKRGFTTLQLLDLAALATANGLQATGNVPLNKKNQPKKLGSSSFVPQQLVQAIPGLQLPSKARLNIIGTLAGDNENNGGWFNNGKVAGAFRAKTVEGQNIERLRAQILNYVVQYLAYLAPQYWVNNATAGVAAGRAAAGTALERALKTSWSWGSQKTGRTLQQRYEAVRAVLGQTTAAEPADAPRTGGGIGQVRDWSQQDVAARVAASSGLLSKNVKKYLMGAVKKDARAGASQSVQAQAARIVAPAIRQVFGISADASLAEAQAVIDQRLTTPQAVHQAFVAASQGNSNNVWQTLSASGLNQLLAGLLIAHPRNAAGEKKFSWDSNPNANTAVQQSAATFQAQFDRYIQVGAQGDTVPSDAAKQSSGTRRIGGRGILGTDDTAFQGLNMANPKQVAKFIRKAAQGQYSIEALKAGARLLGAPIDEGAILHATVQSALVEHVVRSYGPNVDAGSAAHVSAVAGALLINKYSKLSKNPALIPAGQAAIKRRLDAMYGHLTAACNKDNYTADDLRRIAKARAIVVDPRAKTEQICAALQAGGAQVEAPAPQVSSGRREQTTAAIPRKPKSGGTSAGLAALANLPGGQLSPGAQSVAQRFAPGGVGLQQQLSPRGTVAPTAQVTRVPSPRGTLTAPTLPPPTAGGGLVLPQGGTALPAGLLSQFTRLPQ